MNSLIFALNLSNRKIRWTDFFFSLIIFFTFSFNPLWSQTPHKETRKKRIVNQTKKVLSGTKKVLKKSATAIKKPVKQLKKAAKPVGKAITKTAQTAAKEVKETAMEAHTLGGKFLQGLINVMIAASPGKTRVYLPAPSSDPNSGMTVGVLPVFLFVNKKEEIQHILAPSITYNRIFKMTGTMRYYWYPKPETQLFTIASYALETNRRFTLRYEDPNFFSKRFYFKFDFTTLRDGSYRFFGFGPNTKDRNQTNYTLKDSHVQIQTGINFLEKFSFIVAHRARSVDVIDGPVDSLPQISNFSPRPIGAYTPKTIFAQRFILSYSSRDSAITPVRGILFNGFGEVGGKYLGGDADYERFGIDLRNLHPTCENRYVTAWRVLYEGENGTNTPFYESSLLGGKDSLRGYGDARFIDRYKASFSIEERMRVYTLSAFNVNVDFEIAPFYEFGTVFHEWNRFYVPDLHHVWGVGFRSIVKPNVVGVIDLGFGDEGSALYVGIDYAF